MIEKIEAALSIDCGSSPQAIEKIEAEKAAAPKDTHQNLMNPTRAGAIL